MRLSYAEDIKIGMVLRFIVAILAFCWTAPPLSAADVADLDSLGGIIKSGTWQERNLAAKTISSVQITDTSQVVHMLVNAIASELENPISSDKVGRRFPLSITGFLKREYTSALLKISPNPSAHLRAFIDTAQGEIRNWIVARVMAAQRDESVHDEVRMMAKATSNPEKRFWAIEGLAAYRDTNDVAIFEKALSDGWRVVDTIPDTYLEDGSPAISPGYPIRVTAMKALRELVSCV